MKLLNLEMYSTHISQTHLKNIYSIYNFQNKFQYQQEIFVV